MPDRLLRLAGWAAVIGAVLLILSTGILDVVFIDLEDPARTAGETGVVISSALKLVALFLVLLGLVGLYLRQAGQSGSFGLVAFCLAFLGTMLLAGDVWMETFAAPYLADRDPMLLEQTGGTLAWGGLITFVLFAVGWLFFGAASLRARVFPRAAVVLLMIGGVMGFAILNFPGAGVFLSVAIAWMGWWLVRDRKSVGAVATR